jgi:hypothetical protein
MNDGPRWGLLAYLTIPKLESYADSELWIVTRRASENTKGKWHALVGRRASFEWH